MNRRSVLLALGALLVSRNLFAGKKKSREVAPPKSGNAVIEVKQPALIDQKKCVHCGTCFKNCPVKAIGEETVEKVDVYTVDPAKCISCGTCIKNCPAKAIAWVVKSEEIAPAAKDTPKE